MVFHGISFGLYQLSHNHWPILTSVTSDDHFERPTRQGIHLPSSNLSNKINQPNSSVANPASVVTNLDLTSCIKPQVSSLTRVFLSECFENPSESSELANSIPDTNGLFFVPAFCGLQAPVNDPTAAAGLIGNLLPRHSVYVVLQNDCNSNSSYTPTSQIHGLVSHIVRQERGSPCQFAALVKGFIRQKHNGWQHH